MDLDSKTIKQQKFSELGKSGSSPSVFNIEHDQFWNPEKWSYTNQRLLK